MQYAYHVVTERPMQKGQQILFDETHHSGVYHRVMEKLPAVEEICSHPEEYADKVLEHHTAVALRELALEELRQREFPHYPSRLSCLYVSETLEEAAQWGEYFASLGRPTYHIVKLKIEGRCFKGEATNCFDGTPYKEENLRLARKYWENAPADDRPVTEILVDGVITVMEIVKEINRNIR